MANQQLYRDLTGLGPRQGGIFLVADLNFFPKKNLKSTHPTREESIDSKSQPTSPTIGWGCSHKEAGYLQLRYATSNEIRRVYRSWQSTFQPRLYKVGVYFWSVMKMHHIGKGFLAIRGIGSTTRMFRLSYPSPPKVIKAPF